MRSRFEDGFTLIELMIAMTILAFISLGVYDITASTFARRESIEAEGDFYNSIRVALDVLGRDLSQIYTPQADALPGDLGRPPRQPQVPGQQPGGGLNNDMPFGQPTDYWGEPINKEGVRASRFNGEESQLTFVASSHMRIYRDSAESELAKIKYVLEDPKVPDPRNPGKVLVKYENTDVFNEEDERRTGDPEIPRFVLLHGVKSIKFEFLDGEKDTWHSTWDTSGIDHKGIYPAIIRATLEILMPNSESTFVVSQQWRPELPI